MERARDGKGMKGGEVKTGTKEKGGDGMKFRRGVCVNGFGGDRRPTPPFNAVYTITVQVAVS